MSNINNCTKFNDNRSKQSELIRANTIFKMGGRPSWKQDGGCQNSDET